MSAAFPLRARELCSSKSKHRHGPGFRMPLDRSVFRTRNSPRVHQFDFASDARTCFFLLIQIRPHPGQKMVVTETEERLQAPPRKKPRQLPNPQSTEAPRDHRLFVPFRALGLVTNHVPFVLQTRSHKGATDGPRIHILTCLGRSWALWEGSKMTLLFVGKQVSL